MGDHSLHVCLRGTGTQRRWFIRVELIMRKILIGAPKFRAEAVGKSLGWTSLTMVSALALGFSALPFNITNGHLTFTQAKAADSSNTEGRGGSKGGGGSQGSSGGQGGSSGGQGGNALLIHVGFLFPVVCQNLVFRRQSRISRPGIQPDSTLF